MLLSPLITVVGAVLLFKTNSDTSAAKMLGYQILAGVGPQFTLFTVHTFAEDLLSTGGSGYVRRLYPVFSPNTRLGGSFQLSFMAVQVSAPGGKESPPNNFDVDRRNGRTSQSTRPERPPS